MIEAKSKSFKTLPLFICWNTLFLLTGLHSLKSLNQVGKDHGECSDYLGVTVKSPAS